MQGLRAAAFLEESRCKLTAVNSDVPTESVFPKCCFPAGKQLNTWSSEAALTDQQMLGSSKTKASEKYSNSDLNQNFLAESVRLLDSQCVRNF